MNLYNVLGAKDWACHLGTFPGLQVPVTTKVPRVHVLQDAKQAASDAISALRQLKSMKLHHAGLPQTECQVKSGVVKLGWSWEATDVWKWNSPAELEHQLKVAMTQVCNHSPTCFVQEWVEMDFEMRLFAVNTKNDIAPGEVIQ